VTEGLSNMLSNLVGQGGGSNNIVRSILKVAGSSGALGGLLSQAGGQNSPISQHLASWVGTGENQSVTPDQVEQAVGSDTVAKVAEDAGISHDEAKSQMAGALPGIIDKLTPNGKLPDLGELSGSLGKLFGH
jgi:uncharacterized protein YidB (DUF937 family)